MERSAERGEDLERVDHEKGAATAAVGWLAKAVRVRMADTAGATGVAGEEAVASEGRQRRSGMLVGWLSGLAVAAVAVSSDG